MASNIAEGLFFLALFLLTMALMLAGLAACTAAAAAAAGNPLDNQWWSPADTGTTPMPDPVVRVSKDCSFSCALAKLASTPPPSPTASFVSARCGFTHPFIMLTRMDESAHLYFNLM